MTTDTLLDSALGALVLVVGVWITVARVSLAAAVGFVAYGLLLTLVGTEEEWRRIDRALLLRASSRLRMKEQLAAAGSPA